MTITVISQGEGGLRQKVELEGFEDLYVDAPSVVGGDESAPDRLRVAHDRDVALRARDGDVEPARVREEADLRARGGTR